MTHGQKNGSVFFCSKCKDVVDKAEIYKDESLGGCGRHICICYCHGETHRQSLSDADLHNGEKFNHLVFDERGVYRAAKELYDAVRDKLKL